jgi:hypothetical protein
VTSREDRQDVNKRRKAGTDAPRSGGKPVKSQGLDHRGEPNPRITNTDGYRGSHRRRRDK